MRFTPDVIRVKQAAVVKIIHRNMGKLLHEFVFGTGRPCLSQFSIHHCRRLMEKSAKFTSVIGICITLLACGENGNDKTNEVVELLGSPFMLAGAFGYSVI